LPVLGWLTFAGLELERAERATREQAKSEQQIRLASWRIDSLMMPIVGPEAARSYADYLPQFPAVASSVPASPYVLGYFELTPADARFSLPPASESAEVEKRREALRRVLDYQQVIARLPSEWLPTEVHSADDNLALLDRAINGDLIPPRANAQVDDEFVKRQQSNVKNIGRELLQNRAGKVAPLATAPTREGVSRPLWIGDDLVLARRVDAGGGEVVQGAWLDWPRLRNAMRAEVSDLLPQVDLVPIRQGSPIDYAHALATLPVQLAAAPAASAGVAWTPLRVALVVAWLGLAAVAVAAGLLLAGMISLGERRAAFVSAVTHELRTPLTTFRMYAEMLGSGMVADENQRKAYLGTLKTEADRLWHLVENVLAYARLERGRPARQFERLTLGELWQRVEPRLADRARQADMELSLEMTDSSRDAAIVTDPAAVEQIVFNLVDNACKYAARATPRTIGVQLAAVNGHAEIRVRDQGAGIAPADARRLFRPFSKSAERAASSAPGVGLGLALCRQLARQMRGDLRYEPTTSGATFVLVLPRD
jgi:signal transduction histidine kinase